MKRLLGLITITLVCLFLAVSVSAEDKTTKTSSKKEEVKMLEGRSCEGPCTQADGSAGTKEWMDGKCFCTVNMGTFDPEKTVEGK